MNTHTPLIASALLAASFISGAAHATLEGRDLDGNLATAEAYYDTDFNITWLADANYAKTSGYVDQIYESYSSGSMLWKDAVTWAANLTFTDGINVYDNWRLPSTLQPDASCGYQGAEGSFGYGCIGSELGHLFYEVLGGEANSDITIIHNANFSLFSNIQPFLHWSGTERTLNPDYYAQAFFMQYGLQRALWKNNSGCAWAVSDGDIGIAAIPEPETYAMMLAGLGLVGAMARRRKPAKV